MLQQIDMPEREEGNLLRKWFTDEFFDLIVWFDDQALVVGFQLCYDKGHDEHALTWKQPSSYYHQRVDDGENRPGKHKSTPILVPDGTFDLRRLADQFKTQSKKIDPAISAFVYEKVLAFGHRAMA